MQILLNAICRAGLNRGRIRDALAGTESYKGVTGDMVFDPNCKNIAPMFLARVHEGKIDYRRITMENRTHRSARMAFSTPARKLPDQIAGDLKIGVFGPHADEFVRSPEITPDAEHAQRYQQASFADRDSIRELLGQSLDPIW